jgi:galactitol-specific phosphotransferase system IIB component
MKKVLIAGGLCGMTMLMAAQKINKRCDDKNISVDVKIHNLWEGAAITGKGFAVIVEMFPYFENMACPVLSGKPFINRIGERELVEQIVGLLDE